LREVAFIGFTDANKAQVAYDKLENHNYEYRGCLLQISWAKDKKKHWFINEKLINFCIKISCDIY